ncbi:MAG: DCC1-like thiol-disulfide oxidoreductase family protein [Bacteroidetes bacterium]|nr:DCC1-like thiol-disulfide oxidoreductase family protein [Bacteroidota bacterium]
MSKKIEINYDGECAFCASSIRWLRQHDHGNQLSYKTLPKGASCVKLEDEDGTWEASTAALRAVGHLGGKWRVISRILMLIPRQVRDALYRLIAKHRHSLSTGVQATQNNAE